MPDGLLAPEEGSRDVRPADRREEVKPARWRCREGKMIKWQGGEMQAFIEVEATVKQRNPLERVVSPANATWISGCGSAVSKIT